MEKNRTERLEGYVYFWDQQAVDKFGNYFVKLLIAEELLPGEDFKDCESLYLKSKYPIKSSVSEIRSLTKVAVYCNRVEWEYEGKTGISRYPSYIYIINNET